MKKRPFRYCKSRNWIRNCLSAKPIFHRLTHLSWKFISVRLFYLKFQINLRSSNGEETFLVTFNNPPVLSLCDNEWHSIIVKITLGKLELEVDGNNTIATHRMPGSAGGRYLLFAGGISGKYMVVTIIYRSCFRYLHWTEQRDKKGKKTAPSPIKKMIVLKMKYPWTNPFFNATITLHDCMGMTGRMKLVWRWHHLGGIGTFLIHCNQDGVLYTLMLAIRSEYKKVWHIVATDIRMGGIS